MARQLTTLFSMALGVFLVAGCGEPPASTGDVMQTGLAPPPPLPESPGTAPGSADDSATTSGTATSGTTAGGTAGNPPPDDNTTRIVAQPGVGAKGNYESKDYISTLVSLRFQATDPIIFARVKKGINDFHTLQGRYPSSHEEFWKQVIEANGIQLPELAEGERYQYDPKAAEETRGEEALFVLQPKK